ncbi:heme biosynthesis HemY N-terminal domain-containing protein [Hydrogenophaga intermedia]|uniref:Putative porphyrin biosynthesis-like protein n=1 Tax=Hydrogenophaga intermedia TaxID=65786 RepID=A0A1L1PM88_HYDIT|nr:heme biosynthesis HemY N-terminal domain-containing protein [Hydrogenophaga intermedia]TMU76238.1 heme biosynthesis protein HemY [Hydrogenophaga intermedia]CDN89924.1 Putative porphyrin biosynthesis-like protein [Hydrogenophaga intermedia]
MRSVFWLLGLAALAVAMAMLVGDNRGTVTLFWPPWRFDVSFNFALFVLIGGFALLYAALRALALLRDLPLQARRWRSQQMERAVVGWVLDALSNQLAGRFVRAQSAARNALDHLDGATSGDWPRREQLRALAHLLAAESAHSLQNRAQRDEHLQTALNPTVARTAPEVLEGALLRATRWAVEDRDASAARARLAELPQGAQRRVQALRLKLRVARLGDATGEALETARLLAKHRAFSPEAARSLLLGLALDALRGAHDLAQLQRVWDGLDAAERAIPELALAAADRAHALLQLDAIDGHDAPEGGQGEDVAARVRDWLAPLWEDFGSLDERHQARLALALEPDLPHLDAAGLARLELLQRQWPQNPHLQYLAGQACLHRQLWGKAAQLLGLARTGLRDATLCRRTWRSLARLAEERGDSEAAQEAWRQAAQID